MSQPPVPLPLKLYPNRTRFVWSLLLMLGFTVVGVWLGLNGDTLAFYFAIPFALLTLAFAILLLPNSSYLLIGTDGFELCQLYRKSTYYWRDIAEFGTYRQGVSDFVAFNYVDSKKEQRGVRRFSKAMAGFEMGLPHSFGMKPAELAQLLHDVKWWQQSV